MKYFIFRPSGFSLISMMIALAITSIFMSALFALMIDNERGARVFRQEMASLNLKASLVKTMTNQDICSCHFDINTNNDLPTGADLRFDTTSMDEIELGSIRENCDFASSNNEIIELDAVIKGEPTLMVRKIKVSDIVPSGSEDQYFGNLVVEYDNRPGYSVLEPISIPLIFVIDSGSGDDSSRPVEACWKKPENVQVESVPCITTDNLDDENGGRTLVGCGGTSEISVARTTAFGFEAGLQTGGQSTYMGYRAGKNHSGTQSTFMGYEAGMDAGGSSSSTAVGYQAGRVATGNNQVFVGYRAGLNTTTGSDNIFVGNQAGLSNATGSRNVAVGSIAARLSQLGSDNVFLGLGSGEVARSGTQRSVFVGASTGRSYLGHESIILGDNTGRYAVGGDDNIFIGHLASRNSSHRPKNLFIGNYSGQYNTGGQNVFLGHNTSPNNKGNVNTYVGCEAARRASGSSLTTVLNTVVGARAAENFLEGERNVFVGGLAGKAHVTGSSNVFLGQDVASQVTSGSNSVFIGKGAGAGETTGDSKFIVGVDSLSTESTWLSGDISTTGNLYVNGQRVSLTSSRILKENIQPVRNFKRYLEDLLKTPLFTYQYKSKKDHPEKTRMGVVSEELPESLQIKLKGKLSHPDWPSIYGTFWAGFKSLHEMLVHLKGSILSKVDSFKEHIQQYGREKVMSFTHLSTIKQQTLEMKKVLKQSSRELEEARREFLRLKKDLENKSDELKMRIKNG